MRRILASCISLVLCLGIFQPVAVHANSVELPKIVITEFATSVTDNGNYEFVELHNAGLEAVDISSWKLTKRTKKTATTATQLMVAPTMLNRILQPGERVAYGTFQDPSIPSLLPTGGTTGKLSDGGGYIELSRGIVNELPIDEVAWGTGLTEGATPILECKVESMEPLYPTGVGFKRVQSEEGEFESRLCSSPRPTPGTADSVLVSDILPPEPEPEPTPEPEEPSVTPPTDETETPPIETGGHGGATYLPILLSELLPDPASPLTDDKDEYIELFNPNDVSVNLEDYRIETGSSWQTGYNLPNDLVIEAHGYVTLTSGASPISLTNSGGQVRILDPDSKVLDQTIYPAAEAGEAWMKNSSGQWVWTAKSTLGVANEFVSPVIVPALSSLKTPKLKAPAKTAASKKPATPKVAAAKKETKKATEKNDTALQPEEVAAKTPNYALLGSVGSAVFGYGLYEYRQDIMNFLRRFRKGGEEE